MRRSIRFKVFRFLILLVLGIIGAFLFIAHRIISEDKLLQAFHSNRYSAERLAEDFDVSIQRSIERSSLIGQLSLKAERKEEARLAQTLLEQDGKYLLLQIVALSKRPKIVREVAAESVISRLRLTLSKIRSAAESIPIPSGSMGPEGKSYPIFLENCSISSQALFLLRFPIKINDSKDSVPGFVQVILDAKKWLRHDPRKQGLIESFVFSPTGKALVHPLEQKILDREDFSDNPLLNGGTSRATPLQQMELNWGRIQYLAMYYPTSHANLHVFSLMDREAVLSASRLLFEKAILLSAFLISVVVLVGRLFSDSITEPIAQLVSATKEIARGNFDVRFQIQSRDEIQHLAQAFNEMARDLKRRREREAHHLKKIREQQSTLISQQKLAALGQLSRSVGHEFGNILQPLMTKLELLREAESSVSALPPGVSRGALLSEMLETIQLGSRICQDLLAFTRRKEDQESPLSLLRVRSVFEKVIRIIRHDLKKKDIQIANWITPESQVYMPEARLLQVFLNLMSNAVYAMNDGGKVTIKAVQESNLCKIRLSDTGRGVPPELLPHLFEPLFTTKGESGNGLGLYVCKKFIEDAGGRIFIHSVPDVGTSVEIHLPERIVIEDAPSKAA